MKINKKNTNLLETFYDKQYCVIIIIINRLNISGGVKNYPYFFVGDFINGWFTNVVYRLVFITKNKLACYVAIYDSKGQY